MTNFPFGSIGEFADIEAHGVYREAVGAGCASDAVLDGLRRLSRDNARTPMQWDSCAHAGFTTGAPWLAANPNHAWLNVAAQRAAPTVGAGAAAVPASVLTYYRALIRLRGSEAALSGGDVSVLLPDDEAVYALARACGARRLLAIANLTGIAREWPTDLGAEWAGAELLLSNRAVGHEWGGSLPPIEAGRPAAVGGSARGPDILGPWEARILRLDMN